MYLAALDEEGAVVSCAGGACALQNLDGYIEGVHTIVEIPVMLRVGDFVTLGADGKYKSSAPRPDNADEAATKLEAAECAELKAKAIAGTLDVETRDKLLRHLAKRL